jgi:hypothetical protein
MPSPCHYEEPPSCHCEERSDEAISILMRMQHKDRRRNISSATEGTEFTEEEEIKELSSRR